MFRPPLGRSGNTHGKAHAPSLRARAFLLLALPAAIAALAGCGGGTRQDANEPDADFPVQIVKSEFPTRQRLAETTDLKIGVRNSGTKTIPQLAVTISTDPHADDSFSVRSEQQGLAIPSRAVWELNSGYPTIEGGKLSVNGAAAAQTKTYNFGPLDAGETREMIWRVTPVMAGNFTLSYTIAAGLNGKAKAVTADGSVPEGEFAVRISDVPPQTRVDDAGNVVPIKPNDIIGQAGSQEQRNEVGAGNGGGTGTTGTGTTSTGSGGGGK